MHDCAWYCAALAFFAIMASRLEAIAIRLEAMAIRLEAMAIRLEAIHVHGTVHGLGLFGSSNDIL